VAIIPNVIKVGFIAGLRRGHGVVLVRGPDGNWTLPQFVTLTGGSVGWQAGIQGTDVVLVFMTRKSIEGLMSGKFTIGADAAAAAGPVGRNAAAATDARLGAEILSYSRSRGLFVGVSLDGSAIEINPVEQTTYFGAGPGQAPARVPESATRLIEVLMQATQAGAMAVGVPAAVPAGGSTVRASLSKSATQLYAILDDPWRRYLAVPREVFDGATPPNYAALQTALAQYDQVARDPKYQSLAVRAEFQSTHLLLGDYVREMAPTASARLALPPPPTTR
jgi:hypothetical protein